MGCGVRFCDHTCYIFYLFMLYLYQFINLIDGTGRTVFHFDSIISIIILRRLFIQINVVLLEVAHLLQLDLVVFSWHVLNRDTPN